MQAEKLLSIAGNYGTPIYVYDLEKIREQYRKLSEAFRDIPADIHYAVKANPNDAVIRTLDEAGSKFDTVSIQEAEFLLSENIPAENIIYTPSCPSEEEIRRAFELGIHIHIGAIEYLDYVGRRFPGKKIGLRINPDVSVQGNMKIATAHAMSKFGIPWANNKELLKKIKKNKLIINGLHIHLGSDVHLTEDLKKGVNFLAGIHHLFPDLEYLDFGSGLKVKYHKKDSEINPEEYADFIRKKLKEINRPLRVKIEPGKFLVAEAGYFLMRVNIVKQGTFKTFAGVNTGFNHMIRPMYYDAYHEIVNISNPGGKPQMYDIVGNLCEEDTFARSRKISEIRPGDILALKNAGAYGFIMASHYNMRPLPKEIAVDGDRIFET